MQQLTLCTCSSLKSFHVYKLCVCCKSKICSVYCGQGQNKCFLFAIKINKFFQHVIPMYFHAGKSLLLCQICQLSFCKCLAPSCSFSFYCCEINYFLQCIFLIMTWFQFNLCVLTLGSEQGALRYILVLFACQ